VRPGWDEWALGIARAVAVRGDCVRRQVGAVILDVDHRLVVSGYNGAPPGAPGCLSGACPRAQSDVAPGSDYEAGPGRCIAIHAEINALMNADPARLPGGVMYVTEKPCDWCAKVIGGSRLARAVWPP
jgi:dCMP deaminase